ncbi:membrane protein [Synergistales bacterium]|nr:membrane protein [Synergistales bacterium]
MFEYLIVADDYTGATEVASKFMNGRYKTSVTMDYGSIGLMQNRTAVALNTETFFCSPDEAKMKLATVSKNLLPWKGSAVFFKRIEPALRGNVGAEVSTMAREMNFDYVVVAPAFSRGRRAVEEGTLYLDSHERMSHQTYTTSKSASIEMTAEALRKEGMAPVEVSLDDVQEGKVEGIVAQKGCFCFDAETDEDLKMIVMGVLKATPSKNVLWVGSVGLAEAMAMTPKSFVVVIGTAHPRSIRQAKHLLDQAMAFPVQLDAGVLKGTEDAIAAERSRVVEEAEHLLRRGQSILLAATINGRFVSGSYPDDNIESFLGFLSETVREIIGRIKVGGLCVTGGDCAVRIVEKAKAESVMLIEEIQEGITFSRLSGGTFNNLPLISKSGALGGERALVHCMEYFTTGEHENKYGL